jgi:hypothetical protein
MAHTHSTQHSCHVHKIIPKNRCMLWDVRTPSRTHLADRAPLHYRGVVQQYAPDNTAVCRNCLDLNAPGSKLCF